MAAIRIRNSTLVRRMGEYDAHLCLLFNRAVHRPWVNRFFAVVSRLGNGVFWYLLMGAMVLLGGREGLIAALHMLAVGLVGLAIYKALKDSLVRPRPFAVVQQIRLGTPPLDLYSFPSGHTLHAVGFTLVALQYYPGLAWLLVPFTLLVAASRVVLGLHYPSDVVAGAAIGMMLALATAGMPAELL